MNFFQRVDSILCQPRVTRWIGPVLVVYSIYTLWLLAEDQKQFTRDAQTIQSLQTQLNEVSRERKSLRLQLSNKQFDDQVNQFSRDRAEALKGQTK